MAGILRLSCLLLLTHTAHADLVSTSVVADVYAEFDGATDSASSTASGDTIGAFVAADNSFTDSDQTWAFDSLAQSLTGSGLVVTEKTTSPKPGGRHLGTNSLLFTFEIDRDVDFALDGTFGFSSALNGTNDSLLYALTGPSGTVVSGSTSSTAGITSDAFSHSGTLLNDSGTGTTIYTLAISSSLDEPINNQGSVSAGWQLTAFQITSTPEPSSILLLGFSLVIVTIHRKRRTLCYGPVV